MQHIRIQDILYNHQMDNTSCDYPYCFLHNIQIGDKIYKIGNSRIQFHQLLVRPAAQIPYQRPLIGIAYTRVVLCTETW